MDNVVHIFRMSAALRATGSVALRGGGAIVVFDREAL